MKTTVYAGLAVLAALGAESSSAAAKKLIAEADAEGNAIVNEDAPKAKPKRFVVPEENGWLLEPLGAAGDLKLNDEMPVKPAFRPRAAARDGLRLFGAGVKDAVIVAQHGPILQKPMNELRYHLEEMIGREIYVASDFPTDGRAALTVQYCKGPAERSVVRVEGGVVFIEGPDAQGLSHALTYFLEALGCRYLWPGKTGKVIPKRAEVAVPDGLALDFVPSLKIRRMRDYHAIHERRVNNARIFGTDSLKAAQRAREAAIDHFENRTFWQWHGLNDSVAVPGDEPTDDGKYRWEHRFNDYYVRFGKTHPEWFALQPDGTREMDNRPTFCMSQEGLVDQIAEETIEMYRHDPSVVAHTLCLPDGGYKTWCHCAACRRLDPVNAAKSYKLLILPQGRERRAYVEYSDRILNFYNRIIAKVKREFPDKRFTMYAYASYAKPPVKETPDPSLIIISVAGGYYRTPADRMAAQKALAAWGTFGNEMIWRPNAPGGYTTMTPANNARWFFDDVELFKANHVIGTDFDVVSKSWALKGLQNYILAKAHLNPDRWDYETYLDDYCDAAFGKGAPAMKRYFAALERLYDRVAAAWSAEVAAADPRRPIPRTAGPDCYLRLFDADDYEGYFREARAAAADDADALRRLAFLHRGLECGRLEKRAAEAVWANASDLKKAQGDFLDFVRASWRDEPFAIGLSAGHYGTARGRSAKK